MQNLNAFFFNWKHLGTFMWSQYSSYFFRAILEMDFTSGDKISWIRFDNLYVV